MAQITTTVETVTPELAQRWLDESNRNNRKPTAVIVARYADDMAAGDWQVGTGTIVFSDKNALLDGQHRLLACVKSGVSFETVVLRGVDAAAYDAIDTGRVRHLKDLLERRGLPNSTTLAAVTRMDWRLVNGKIFAAGAGYGTLSRAMAIRHLDANPGIPTAVSLIHTLRRSGMVVPPAAAGTFLHRIRLIDSLEATLFIDAVASGENIAAGQPAYALRSWLQNSASKGSLREAKPSSDIYLAYLIKAWNAWAKGDTMQMLAFKRSGSKREQFPQLVDMNGDPFPLVNEVDLPKVKNTTES